MTFYKMSPSNTPITLDEDCTTISKFGNIGPECRKSLLDVHTLSTVSKGQGGIAMDVDIRGERGQILSMFKSYVTRSWDGKNAVNTHCEHCNNRLQAETA